METLNLTKLTWKHGTLSYAIQKSAFEVKQSVLEPSKIFKSHYNFYLGLGTKEAAKERFLNKHTDMKKL